MVLIQRKFDPFLPLKLSVFYLLGTLFLFEYGPISYEVQNRALMFAYLAYYLVFASVGYFLGVKQSRYFHRITRKRIFKVNFWILAAVALFSAMIINMNYAKLPSLFPSNLLDALTGNINLLEIGKNYYKRHVSAEDYVGSKYLNAFNLLLAWTKAVLIGFVVINWEKLSLAKRIAGTAIIMVPVLSAILVGTNKPVFDLVLIAAVSLWIKAYRSKHKRSNKSGFSKRVIAIIVVSILSVAFLFSQAMSQRGASAAYVEYTSMRGDIEVQVEGDTGFSAFYVIATHYLVQGYYGFGLALEQSFSSTFGFGHSKFLLRQASSFDDNFAERTFQAKVSNYWHSDRQWHSAFSEFANDVHFIGVGVVMGFLFFWLAVTWMLAARFGYREAVYLMPLHAMSIFFLPANNQVFGFIDSLSAYVFLSFLILFRANVIWGKGGRSA